MAESRSTTRRQLTTGEARTRMQQPNIAPDEKVALWRTLLSCISEEKIPHFTPGELRTLWKGLQISLQPPEQETLLTKKKCLVLIRRKLDGCCPQWRSLFQNTLEENHPKLKSLRQIIKSVMDNVLDDQMRTDSLSEALANEEHIGSRVDISKELNNRRDTLMTSLVIVAGETNSGKSSVINLLLGTNILPTDVIRCTSSICKIVYSEQYGIEVVTPTGEHQLYQGLTLEEAKAKLPEIMAVQNFDVRESGGEVYQTVTLRMPAQILKSGITLVDTPGVGENEVMDDVTTSYFRSTHASGFIYVIKSDNGGGVREDRLVNLMEAIKERFANDRLSEAFDPEAAIFVCNRMDAVPEDEKETTKRHILTKLQFVWPKFKREQVKFFSTLNSKLYFDVDYDLVTDELFELFQGVKQVFDRANHNALKHHYLWLKNILPAMSRHLKTVVIQSSLNCEEQDEFYTNLENQLKRLEQAADAQGGFTEINAVVDQQIEELKRQIVKIFLDLKDVNDLSSEFPSYSDIVSAYEKDLQHKENAAKENLDCNIIEALESKMTERLEQLGLIKEMEDTILKKIQHHLGLFKPQVEKIKKGMVQPVSSKHRTLKLSLQSYEGSNSSTQDLRTQDPAQFSSAVDSMLKGEVTRKSSNPSFENPIHQVRLSKFSRTISKLKNLTSTPEEYVKRRFKKKATQMAENDKALKFYADGLLVFVEECVRYARASVPRFIANARRTIANIISHRQEFINKKDAFKNAMEKLEKIRHALTGYAEMHLNEIELGTLDLDVSIGQSVSFDGDSLNVSCTGDRNSGFVGTGRKHLETLFETCSDDSDEDEDEEESLVDGIWSKMRSAMLHVSCDEKPVTVRTYLKTLKNDQLFSEIAALRCLPDKQNDKPFSKFIGMARIRLARNIDYDQRRGSQESLNSIQESYSPFPVVESLYVPDEKVPAFIFEGTLVSARRYIKRFMTDARTFAQQLIMNLLRGLKYLHKEGLVHMELSLDTVMVDSFSGEVKLCHMSLPRKAEFPENPELVKTNNCVYLSPDVLRGRIYSDADDMYAFGLLLLEILLDCKVFEKERGIDLQTFIVHCQPLDMLVAELDRLKPSEVRNILDHTTLVSRDAVHFKPNEVITLLDSENFFSKNPEEPNIKALKSRRSSWACEFRVNAETAEEDQDQTFKSPLCRKNNAFTSKQQLMNRRQSVPTLTPLHVPSTSEEEDGRVVHQVWQSSLNQDELYRKFYRQTSRESLDEASDSSETSDSALNAYLERGRRSTIAVPCGETLLPASSRCTLKSQSSESDLQRLSQFENERGEANSPIHRSQDSGYIQSYRGQNGDEECDGLSEASGKTENAALWGSKDSGMGAMSLKANDPIMEDVTDSNRQQNTNTDEQSEYSGTLYSPNNNLSGVDEKTLSERKERDQGTDKSSSRQKSLNFDDFDFDSNSGD